MRTTPQPWWRTDLYEEEESLPQSFTDYGGPNGPALVVAWPDGRTTAGWGDVDFMGNYMKGAFNPRRVLYGYNKGQWAFAVVMRSVKMLCIDIDGKNGGLEHAKKLGALPPTMAETSKSGDGYHLFYLVDDQWDDDAGFGSINDRIGVEQGVDIRATGCVYHHDTQRWNGRSPVLAPDFLIRMLLVNQERRAHRAAFVAKVIDSQDETEILLMHDQLITDLAKPIPAGKRNNTLFAIGQQMKQAQIPDWEDRVAERAGQVGLDADEVGKLLANIERYN